jgi:hypothetical protein
MVPSAFAYGAKYARPIAIVCKPTDVMIDKDV